MSIITTMRRQTAVWWQRSTSPDGFGRYTYAAPIQIDCRWEDIVVEFLDPQGNKTQSRSVVYVDRVIAAGDMLMEGDWESNTADDPTEEELAFEVRRFDKLPNLKNTETLYTAYL